VSGNPKGAGYAPEQGSILGVGAKVSAHDMKAPCHSTLQIVMVDNATLAIPNLYDVVLELRRGLTAFPDFARVVLGRRNTLEADAFAMHEAEGENARGYKYVNN